MSNVFSRSWKITKLSFGVIKKDKEMLVFPVLAGIFSLIFIIAMLFPTVIAVLLDGKGANYFGALQYIMIFITYLGLAFIATFFNVCVVYTTKKRFDGGNATFGESIGYAFSKIHLIFSWSMVAATVGLILRILDNMAKNAKGAGRIVLRILSGIFGLMWSIITIFVVPSMVYNNLGPIDAIKKSVQVLKKTWGESLIRYYGLGLVQGIFIFVGILVAIPMVLLVINAGAVGVVIVISIVVLYIVLVSLVFGVANSVFNTALYVYADTGRIPEGYSEEIMQNAFKKKESGVMKRGITQQHV